MHDTPTLLDGKKLANIELASLCEHIRNTISQGERAPCLAVIQVGDDPASSLYIARKQAACQLVGIDVKLTHLDQDCTETTLIQILNQLNEDTKVDGILVQLPLPLAIDKNTVFETIHPDKDVDGFHPYHLGRLAQGRPSIRPCTPFGIMRLLKHHAIPLTGMRALVLGRSTLVGRPMMLELCNAGATVTLAHSQSRDLPDLVANTQLIIAATGVKDVIDSDLIPEKAVVVDVGIHRLDDGRLRGDLDSAIVAKRASHYTPVPGGVGPMTVASLMYNTWVAYHKKWTHPPT